MKILKHTLLAASVSLALAGGQAAHAGDEPMLGEIVLYAFNFAPRYWANSNGQILSINQNQALFALLGTTYGGNGQTTFALPDLRGRTPAGSGTEISWGEQAGAATATLTQMPGILGTNLTLETRGVETSSRISNSTPVPTVSKSAVTSGASLPVNVRPPSLGLNYSVALQGLFGGRECTLGEIITYAGTYVTGSELVPANGQLLSISSNTALFSILGTTYGGNGQTTFALPNLNDRLPTGAGSGPSLTPVSLGESSGGTTATVTTANLPANTVLGYNLSTKGIGVGTSTRITANQVNIISATAPVTGNASVSLPIQPPSLGVNYYICTQGVYPQPP
jgi:microcystin-dependent protein